MSGLEAVERAAKGLKFLGLRLLKGLEKGWKRALKDEGLMGQMGIWRLHSGVWIKLGARSMRSFKLKARKGCLGEARLPPEEDAFAILPRKNEAKL